jgi:hypothetical protein
MSSLRSSKKDGPLYIAYCAEAPGANGQGKSREECLASLHEAISLILEYRRPTFLLGAIRIISSANCKISNSACAPPGSSCMIGRFREFSFLLLCYHLSEVWASPSGGEVPRFLRLRRLGHGPVLKADQSSLL